MFSEEQFNHALRCLRAGRSAFSFRWPQGLTRYRESAVVDTQRFLSARLRAEEKDVLMRICWMSGGIALLVAWAWTVPAQALTMHECSVKYKQDQSAGKLQGMGWNAFRKAECGSDAAVSSATTTAAPVSAVQAGRAVFPSAVSSKYANQSAGKARMHTCLDQYRANKASGGNGSLKWIQKSGGYYSECNKRLGGR